MIDKVIHIQARQSKLIVLHYYFINLIKLVVKKLLLGKINLFAQVQAS